jgi:ABC-type polysaccharide/polyol phosphate export permease
MEPALRALVTWQIFRAEARDRWRDELGEGVISTAIAVLIMALIGLAMWQLFSRVFSGAGQRVESNVNQIG